MPRPIDGVLKILLAVAAGRGEPQTPARVAAQTGLAIPTVSRLLQELAEAGFLEQLSRREGYAPGPLAFYLGGGRRYREELTVQFEDPLQTLSRRFETRAELSIRVDFARHILLAFERGERLAPPPLTADLYRTAAGRLLLATAPETHRIHLIWEHGIPEESQWPETADSRDRFRELLDAARQHGALLCADGSAAVSADSETVLSLANAGPDGLEALQAAVTAASVDRNRPQRGK